nr:MAG TPA: Protein of unknown function (DUF2577) [Caudoviricetes sp.]
MYDFVEAVKQAALEAVESKDPMRFCFGRVSKVDPLEIWIDQKLTVPESALILTGMVSKHSVEVEGQGKIALDNSLKVGEQVILIRVDGGQKYIVLDRAR